jgi:predicted RecB family nuclease
VDAFKKGETGGDLTGTPLEELPGIDLATRATLKAMGVPSVEALSEMAESAVTGLMGGRKFKTLAKAWLEQRAGEAPLLKMAAELEARDKRIAELERANADILARVAAIEESSKSDGKRKAA